MGSDVHTGVLQLFTICFNYSGIGEKLVTLLWGGYFVSQAALKPFFCFLISFYRLF
jgi:quinol-cytochrome oxidoreductase complex cytochrome b subunit